MLKFARRFALLVVSLLRILLSQSAIAQQDTKLLTEAFALDSSAHSRYAEPLDEGTFYYQLNIINKRQELKGDKCVDQNFITWIRKFFKQDAKDIALVASIMMPDRTTQKIPLFEISMDEKAKPPQCLTTVLTSMPITPLFVGRRGGGFALDVIAKTQQNVNINVAHTTISAATDLLSLTGGSAWLMKEVSTSQAAVSNAVSKIDESLSNNWSSTAQADYHFTLSPWPSDGDWTKHVDEAKFAVGSLVSGNGGIKVDETLLPTIAISMQFTTSQFGSGPGHYLPESQIMSSHLASNAGDTLENILKLGIAGFTTDNALAISDSTAMTKLCRGMQSTFSNFMTADDILAARHAVLYQDTTYYQSNLYGSPSCESETEKARLRQLSRNFIFPDDLVRRQAGTRDAFVKQRGALLTSALLAGNADKLSVLLADPTKFVLSVIKDADDMFPNLAAGANDSGAGSIAVSNLTGAGAFRSGCWSALPAQNLRNMVGAVLNKKSGASSAILVEFDSDFPGIDADPSTDKPKITKVSFLPVDVVQSVASLPNWPDQSCPLL